MKLYAGKVDTIAAEVINKLTADGDLEVADPHEAQLDVASVLKLQPAAIGFSLAAGALGPHGPKTDAYARILASIEQSHHHGVSVGVEGDIQPAHARRFTQDGVNHICSPRIWPLRRALPAAELWPAARLGAEVMTETAA